MHDLGVGACGQQKPLRDFYRNKRSRDGSAYLCKTCVYERVRAWQRANPDKLRAQQRRYYRSQHPQPRPERKPKPEREPPTEAELRERKKHRQAYQREYQCSHRARLREQKRAYRQKHAQAIRAYWRKYYRENHTHLLELKAKYRKRRRGARDVQDGIQ